MMVVLLLLGENARIQMNCDITSDILLRPVSQSASVVVLFAEIVMAVMVLAVLAVLVVGAGAWHAFNQSK